MYQVVVVGTDGSERAARAVDAALDIAAAFGSTLHVVNAVHSSVMMGAEFVDAAALADADEQIRRHGAEICAAAVAEAAARGVTASAHNLVADPADALIDVAESVDADLLVVGNRGMTGIKRFVLGSVPNKVSHHTPCSLLIVDTDAK
jgi:nucleotide-binding universal stress UspA family protein